MCFYKKKFRRLRFRELGGWGGGVNICGFKRNEVFDVDN